MKEFIDKLIERLKEKLLEYINKANNEMIENGHTLDFENFLGHKEAYENVLYDIVKELVEEYKGGWIPCSVELPKEQGWYLAHVKHRLNGLVTIEKVIWKKCKYGSWKFYRKGNDCEVIAWMPLPAPYTEGEKP